MEKEDIIRLLKERIKSCYKDLLFARSQKGYRKDWIEGFRSRLDELILVYHEIYNIDFVNACEELGVKYQDVNTEEEE